MEKICPEHVEGFFLKRLSPDNKYLLDVSDSFTFSYEITCTCSNDLFYVYKDTKPTVILKCTSCRKNIVVYDLKYYPAAAKINEDRPLVKYFSENNDEVFNICVKYEYSDEFAIDSEDFDRNDLSWCIVYGYGIESKEVFEIINDETA